MREIIERLLISKKKCEVEVKLIKKIIQSNDRIVERIVTPLEQAALFLGNHMKDLKQIDADQKALDMDQKSSGIYYQECTFFKRERLFIISKAKQYLGTDSDTFETINNMLFHWTPPVSELTPLFNPEFIKKYGYTPIIVSVAGTTATVYYAARFFNALPQSPTPPSPRDSSKGFSR